MRSRLHELTRFGTVGALAYVIDVGSFNLLRYGPGELLGAKPLTAKVASVAIATLIAWLGNRYWTFPERRTSTLGRELAGFAVVNLGGMAIGVGSLAFSHYVLGMTSALADNVSANVVGLALGTAFRYLAYRTWVFTGQEASARGAAATTTSPGARGHEGTAREHDGRVERPWHTSQEHGEDRRPALREPEPAAASSDEVPGGREA